MEEIEGDLREIFQEEVQEKGLKQARRNFIWMLFPYLRPYFWGRKTIELYDLIPIGMYKNYFKVAMRNLKKQRFYAFIKISGLAMGIAACLLIGLYIRHELSYDRYYPDAEQLYRVIGTFDNDGEIIEYVWFPAPFADALVHDYPEIEEVGRVNATPLFYGIGNNQIRPTDAQQSTYEEGFIFVDPFILDMLDVNMVYGTRETALDDPMEMVLTRSKAEKFFPGENPVGKTMILNNDENMIYTVGGVMENLPSNTHLQDEFWMTMTEKEFWDGEQQTWRSNNYHTYVKLRQGTNAELLEKKLLSIIDNYFIPSRQDAGMADAVELSRKQSFKLQPVKDIYLTSYDIRDRIQYGDIRLIWLFGAVAGFILIIACINFINLSTAKSANRAKEVGLRKVMGSYQRNLVNQFLTESILYSVFSFAIGMILAELLLPYFNQLSGKELFFPWDAWWFIPTLLLVAVVIGILAGLYPSIYLSAFQPVKVLKGEFSRGSKSAILRSILVVFQFTTSIVLIIGTFIIYRQMDFILNKKLGFDKEQVLLLHGANTMGEKVPTFKEELLQMDQIQHVAVSDFLPVSGTKRNGNGFWKEGRVNTDSRVPGQIWRVDHDYVKTMGIRIVDGRDFSLKMPSDSQAVLINEAMVKILGLEKPLESRITNGFETWQVIGVVEDFHFQSLKMEIEPLCLVIGNSNETISVKLNTRNLPGLIQTITAKWDDFSPNQPIRFTFLDERYASMYDDIKRTGNIFTSFSVFAIFVACLGLFALAAFMAEQRKKEIGIRKVLGASIQHIFGLLTKNFLRLVLISMLIAIPLGWYLMHRWLEDFAYRITIQWDVFIIAGLMAITIAILTISYQALRAANVNPVESIQNE